MRTILMLACVAGCSEGHFQQPALPPLVVEPKPVLVTGGPLMLEPGEKWIWEVSSGGMTIGRAEMAVGDTEVYSRFHTDELASMFSQASDELTTTIDRAQMRPTEAHERLEIDGNTRELGGAIVPPVHTIHSALGWLRAWAAPDHPPATIVVVHAGERWKLACEPASPDEIHDKPTLRIACRVAANEPIAITLWLTADSGRVPLRIVARAGSLQLAAELVSR